MQVLGETRDGEDFAGDLNPRRFTVREYYRMAELGLLGEDERLELLEGVIVRMTPQSVAHARTISRLNALLAERLPPRQFRVRVQLPLRLSDTSEPEPDLAVVPTESEEREDSHPTTAPLVIEVAYASSRKDRVLKRRLYAQAGIAEYILVDAAARKLTVYSDPDAKQGSYRHTATLDAGDEWISSALPGLKIAVAGIVG